jgi:hypothetical protein
MTTQIDHQPGDAPREYRSRSRKSPVEAAFHRHKAGRGSFRDRVHGVSTQVIKIMDHGVSVVLLFMVRYFLREEGLSGTLTPSLSSCACVW